VIATVWAVDARWERLPAIFTEAPTYIALMVDGLVQNPLEMPWSEYWTKTFGYMFESLQMAWMGTVIGALLSFPLSFLAASNVAPRWLVLPVRQLLNVIRALPEIVLAIAFMIPIFGLGALAGTMALGIGSVGTLGKLSSEAIEEIDRGPVEALQATGANTAQSLRWAVVPQALPELVAFCLYRFEINIRASALLGIVGAAVACRDPAPALQRPPAGPDRHHPGGDHRSDRDRRPDLGCGAAADHLWLRPTVGGGDDRTGGSSMSRARQLRCRTGGT